MNGDGTSKAGYVISKMLLNSRSFDKNVRWMSYKYTSANSVTFINYSEFIKEKDSKQR